MQAVELFTCHQQFLGQPDFLCPWWAWWARGPWWWVRSGGPEGSCRTSELLGDQTRKANSSFQELGPRSSSSPRREFCSAVSSVCVYSSRLASAAGGAGDPCCALWVHRALDESVSGHKYLAVNCAGGVSPEELALDSQSLPSPLEKVLATGSSRCEPWGESAGPRALLFCLEGHPCGMVCTCPSF